MSASRKTSNKCKESPYYGGGGHVEVPKSSNKLYDGKNSDENKLPKLGNHFSVITPNRNPFKHEASSTPSLKAYYDEKAGREHDSEQANDSSKVKKIVSGFNKGLWGTKRSNRNLLASTIILEEDPFTEQQEHEDMQDAAGEHHKALNGCAITGSQSACISNDAPHAKLIPLRSFDLNSTSINPLPDMADSPLPTVPPHPKLVDIPNEEEHKNSKLDHNNTLQFLKRSLSMESQALTDLLHHLEESSARAKTNHNASDDKMHAQDKHGLEVGSRSLMEGRALGWNKHNTNKSMEIQELKDSSETKQLPSSSDKSKKFDEEEPYQAQVKREDSMDALPNAMDGGQENFKTKDENTPIKITGTHKDEKVFLLGIASAFYNGGSLSLHGELCYPNIGKINKFLDERLDEVHAGVPGKWLTIVLGSDSSELSTVVATIVYAYFLSLTTREDQLCIVPVVNMVREDLALHPDVTWLLNSIGLHLSSLLFLDEINLSYFHRYGSLRLVLVNHTKLAPGQEEFKDDVEEILAVHEQVAKSYPHLKTIINDKDVGSSCTVIAEGFTKHHPELLAGRAICRLLLAGILLDTTNLSAESTTRRDTSMVTLLLNGAGKFGRNGLFKILKQKSHDLTNMNTNELLRKQFKLLSFNYSGVEEQSQRVYRYEENVGMSSLPIPVSTVLAWEENSPHAVADFPRCMALGLFMLVTGYYETPELFKREVLVVAKDDQLIGSISNFLLANKSVKCISMALPAGVPSCVRGFSLEGKRISRSFIQNILEDYFS